MNEDVVRMDYETAVAALQHTVEQLGHGQEDLAESVRAYERGLLLAQHCSQLLRDAGRRLDLERPPTTP